MATSVTWPVGVAGWGPGGRRRVLRVQRQGKPPGGGGALAETGQRGAGWQIIKGVRSQEGLGMQVGDRSGSAGWQIIGGVSSQEGGVMQV